MTPVAVWCFLTIVAVALIVLLPRQVQLVELWLGRWSNTIGAVTVTVLFAYITLPMWAFVVCLLLAAVAGAWMSVGRAFQTMPEE